LPPNLIRPFSDARRFGPPLETGEEVSVRIEDVGKEDIVGTEHVLNVTGHLLKEPQQPCTVQTDAGLVLETANRLHPLPRWAYRFSPFASSLSVTGITDFEQCVHGRNSISAPGLDLIDQSSVLSPTEFFPGFRTHVAEAHKQLAGLSGFE
jgi:hypothetical protein